MLSHRAHVHLVQILVLSLLAVLDDTSPSVHMPYGVPYKFQPHFTLTCHLAILISDSPLLSACSRLSSLSDLRTTRAATAR